MNKPKFHFFTLPIIRYGSKIPFIITDLISQLYANNCTEVEGIFRLAGSSTLLQELSDDLDQGRVKDWSKYQNAVTLACGLKAYFRALAKESPLIPNDFYQDFIAIAQESDDPKVVSHLIDLTHKLPPSHLLSLSFLMNFLHEVAKNSSRNKMTPENLAICMAPNLMTSHTTDPQKIIKENAQQNTVISLIIAKADEIFKDININENYFLTDSEINIIQSMMIPKETRDAILDRQNFRKNSLIPYIPSQYYQLMDFKRPDRIV